jgi:hypothetical protein
LAWLDNWKYRKSHIINGSPDGAQTDYQMGFYVGYNSSKNRYIKYIFNLGQSGYFYLPANQFYGAKYTPSSNENLSAVDILCKSESEPSYGKALVIRTSDRVIIGISEITTIDNTGEFKQFVFSSPVALTASTEYAIGLVRGTGISSCMVYCLSELSGVFANISFSSPSNPSSLSNANVKLTMIFHFVEAFSEGENINIDNKIFSCVFLNNKCRTDFGDVRFTSSDGKTLLDYWIEEQINSDYAKIWVKIPSVPAYPNSTTIYIYYGKSSATSIANLSNTFIFGQDFRNSQNYDSNKWNLHNSPNLTPTSAGLTIEGVGHHAYLVSKTTYSFNTLKQLLFTRKCNSITISYNINCYIMPNIPTAGGDPYVEDNFVLTDAGKDGYDGTNVGLQTKVAGMFYRTSGIGVDTSMHLNDIRIRLNSTNKKIVYFYETYLHTSHTNVPTISDNYIFIGVSTIATATLSGVFGYIILCNLTDNEPSHSTWGTEETFKPSGGNIAVLMSTLGLI